MAKKPKPRKAHKVKTALQQATGALARAAKTLTKVEAALATAQEHVATATADVADKTRLLDEARQAEFPISVQ